MPLIALLIFSWPVQLFAQQNKEKEDVLKVARQFFEALEKQDTITFKKIMMKNSNSYMVIEGKDSVRLIGRPHNNFNLKPENIVKERMRESEVIVNIHRRIATIWAPYDLWVNDKYSHCGVDVFIMLKGNQGWKIGTISFSIEKEGCK
jgi:hypothetical protein